MAVNIEAFQQIIRELQPFHAHLVAVSKTKPAEDILELYQEGQKTFGENYVQELVEKQAGLPKGIEWHFIGHLQRNKVKYIAPFISMIQSVDSLKLLKEINKQAKNADRIIDCLLQVHIAEEETKFGLDENELIRLLEEVMADSDSYSHIRIRGLMGMATFTKEEKLVREEFQFMKSLFEQVKEKYVVHLQHFTELSLGMSADYKLALEEGSTLVRIGSLLFGQRTNA